MAAAAGATDIEAASVTCSASEFLDIAEDVLDDRSGHSNSSWQPRQTITALSKQIGVSSQPRGQEASWLQ